MLRAIQRIQNAAAKRIAGKWELEISDICISAALRELQVPYGILRLNTPCTRYVITLVNDDHEKYWTTQAANKLNEIRLRKGSRSTILFTLKNVFTTRYYTTFTVDTLIV